MFEHDGPGVSSSVGHSPVGIGGSEFHASRIAASFVPGSTITATHIAGTNGTTRFPISAGTRLHNHRTSRRTWDSSPSVQTESTQRDWPGLTATIGAAWPGD